MVNNVTDGFQDQTVFYGTCTHTHVKIYHNPNIPPHDLSLTNPRALHTV